MYLGLLLVVLGVLFLLKNLGIIAGNFWNILWPAAIVLVGIAMIFGRKRPMKK